VKRLLNEIDNYQLTLEGCLAFCNEACWNAQAGDFVPEFIYSLGRRMKTSDRNAVSPNTDVTPDLLVQLGDAYGIVGEAKPTVRDDENRLRELRDQLEKYDDDLMGWMTDTGGIDSNDLTVLTHISNAAYLEDHFTTQAEEGNWNPTRAFSIVSFSRDLQREVFIFLQKRAGSFSRDELDRRLHNGVSVPFGRLQDVYTVMFHDTEPPVAHTMGVIWNHVLPQLPSEEQFIEAGGVRSLLVSANVDEITTMLRDQFGPPRNDERDRSIPRREWIVHAFQALEQLGLADRHPEQEDTFIVNFRKGAVGDDPVRFFVEGLASAGQQHIDLEWESG
jgi:hypothetical protein